MSSLIRPEIKLIQAFMPVLVTSNFDDDSIKNERASMETAFSLKYFRRSRAAISVVSGPIWPKFEFYACPHYLQVKKGSDQKQSRKGGDIIFPIISQWGLSVAMESQSFDPICPKTLCSLSPTPVLLHINFDQDWPTGFRDIQV